MRYVARLSRIPLAMIYDDDDLYHVNTRRQKNDCAGKSMHLIVSHKQKWPYYVDSVCVNFGWCLLSFSKQG